MKHTYPIKTCPWCGETGKFSMDTPLDETWMPRIKCKNFKCEVQPQTKYIPIRKAQRSNPQVLKEKIETVIKKWNDGNCGFINEGFELDFERIAKDFKEGSIGLPGHRQDRIFAKVEMRIMKWIKVQEKLPPLDFPVLAYDGERIEKAFRTEGSLVIGQSWYWTYYDFMDWQGVTHWTFLPEIPEARIKENIPPK